jgi:hypothetical protein
VRRVSALPAALALPAVLAASLRGIGAATYLPPSPRRGIVYDNAARFVRLTPAQTARHHGR